MPGTRHETNRHTPTKKRHTPQKKRHTPTKKTAHTHKIGLAAGGYNGVDKALSILSRDIYLAMGLLGCRTVAELKLKAPELLLVKKNQELHKWTRGNAGVATDKILR